MPCVFTTLRHSFEKLLGADHFLGRLIGSYDLEFQVELHPFLSAIRGVCCSAHLAKLATMGAASVSPPGRLNLLPLVLDTMPPRLPAPAAASA